MTILILCALASLVARSDSMDTKGLLQVHLLFRHGDRTPIAAYPTDPYKNYSWPGGWGQLTVAGMRRHHELGVWLRSRYGGWLSDKYDKSEIHVRSTDTDRTLMSALSNLAGLYPPSGDQVWDPEIPWQPIPVHTVPQSEDYLLSSHAKCPRFESLQLDILSGEWMTNLYKEYFDLFNYVSTNVKQNITDIVRLDYVYDTLLIERENNLTLPNWTKQIFPGDGKFKYLRDLSFTVDTLTDELKRLKGGPWVKEMIEHFDTIAHSNDASSEMKIYMYSAHDTTVAPILHTLGVFNNIAPPYASMVMVELHDLGSNSLHVKVLYHNDSSVPPYVMTIPGCQELCPLNKFKDITSKFIPEDIIEECGLNVTDEDQTIQRVTMVAAVCSSVMALTVLVATIFTIFCRKQKKQDNSFNFPQTRYQRVGTSETE